MATKKMSDRYLTEFIKLNSAPELLAMKLFPNAKEITETMAAWSAVRKYILPRTGVSRNDPNVEIVVVGDGHAPRTGALFAFMSKWNVTSVDPALRNKHDGKVMRLKTLAVKIGDVNLYPENNRCPIVIIVHVHSHASLRSSVESIKGGELRYLVNIPCCKPPDLDIEPVVRYVDTGIHSEKNTVEIYKL